MTWTPPPPGSNPASTTQAAATDPLVYWGQAFSPGTPKVAPKAPPASGYNWETQKDAGPVPSAGQSTWDAANATQWGGTMPQSVALNYPVQTLNTDPAQYKALVDKMLKLGLLRPGFQVSNVQQVWSQAVAMATSLGAGSQVSPQNALDLIAAGGDTSTQDGSATPTAIKQYDASTVVGLVNGAFEHAVGRNATKKEQARFLDYINKQEAANPSTRTADGSTQIYGGGIDETQVANDYAAQHAPDATQYSNQNFLNMLKSSFGGG